MNEDRVYYLVGVSTSKNGIYGEVVSRPPRTTYHVTELRRAEALRLNYLRKQWDESLSEFKAKMPPSKGSSDYNRGYNFHVAPAQRAYKGFLRKLDARETGFFRSDHMHIAGEILEKNAIEFQKCEEY